MLGTTIAANMKVTTDVAFCLYVDMMVFTVIIAEYKAEVAYSEPNILMVVRIIGLPV